MAGILTEVLGDAEMYRRWSHGFSDDPRGTNRESYGPGNVKFPASAIERSELEGGGDGKEHYCLLRRDRKPVWGTKLERLETVQHAADPARSTNGVLPPRCGNDGREERLECAGEVVDARERVGVWVWTLRKHRGCLPIPDEGIRRGRPRLSVWFQPRRVHCAGVWRAAAHVWPVAARKRSADSLRPEAVQERKKGKVRAGAGIQTDFLAAVRAAFPGIVGYGEFSGMGA